MSTGFTPTAWLRTSTWPGPGSGAGTSPSFRTEGPPYSETRIAFMTFIVVAPFVAGRSLTRLPGPEDIARGCRHATTTIVAPAPGPVIRAALQYAVPTPLRQTSLCRC